MNFPHCFFSMFRTGSFAMFPRCDRRVTDASITVPGLGTPQCHSGCTGGISPWCATSAHRGFFQDVPRCKPDKCSASVSSRIIPSVMSQLTSRTPFRFIQDVPRVSPPSTPQEHRNTDDVIASTSGCCWVVRDISVGVGVAVALVVCAPVGSLLTSMSLQNRVC